MEKYSQFRDRGSGIAPFLPIAPPARTWFSLPVSALLILVRLPLILAISLIYFCILQYVLVSSLAKKAILWMLLGIPGIWWIDLQIDGVKRGSLSQRSRQSVSGASPRSPPTGARSPTSPLGGPPATGPATGRSRGSSPHLPSPGSIIASSLTSPIDSLYLAAIFDPIFVASYPSTRQVRRISLLESMARALAPPALNPPPAAVAASTTNAAASSSSSSSVSRNKMTTLGELVARHPRRVVVAFPECTTTNGKAILPLSPCLLGAAGDTKIYPVSLRYTPADVTTPVPGAWGGFAWNLLGQASHCIRVRIAEPVYNTSAWGKGGANGGDEDGDEGGDGDDAQGTGFEIVSSPTTTTTTTMRGTDKNRYLTNALDGMASANRRASVGRGGAEQLDEGEKAVLDKVGEALARLGRVKRVGLTASDKQSFVVAWEKKKKR